MGRRGTKPKPTALLKQQGTYQKCRRRGEPEIPPGSPKPPAWLDSEAVEEWRYAVAHLGGHKILTEADRTALAMYAEAVADYVSMRKVVKDEGYTIKTDKGNLIQHPALGAMGRAWDRATKLAREFGMTPSSRAGLHIQAPSEPDAQGKGRFFKVVG